jgi:hypothetical protein
MPRAAAVDARPRPLARRAAFGFGTGIGLGAGLGGLAWLADQLAYPWGALIPANAIGAWVGLGFVLGASARTVPTGALRGVIGLLSAVAAYYLLISLSSGGFRAIGASHAAATWSAVALVAGPVFGAAGASWRHLGGWPRATAVATIAAALIAEGVVFGTFRLDDPGGVLLTTEVAIGALLPAVLLGPRERLVGYLMTAVLALAGGLAIGPVTTLVRGVADRF